MTSLYHLGLLGFPLDHSRSPELHHQWGRAANLPLRYDLFPTQPDDLASTLEHFWASGGHGLNVTAPYKSSVLPWVHSLTPRAQHAQGVNVLWKDSNGNLHGDNVDGLAWLQDFHTRNWTPPNQALPDQNPQGRTPQGRTPQGRTPQGRTPQGRTPPPTLSGPILLLGAGTTARAILAELEPYGPDVDICRRQPTHDLPPINTSLNVRTLSWDDIPLDRVYSGIIQASSAPASTWTPARHANLLKATTPATWVYDLNYGPRAQPFLEAFLTLGMPCCDGFGMLQHQAALCWQRWFPMHAPITSNRRCNDS